MKRLALGLVATCACSLALAAPSARAEFPLPRISLPKLGQPSKSTPNPGNAQVAPPDGDLDAQAKAIYDAISYATPDIGYKAGVRVVEARGLQGRQLVKAKNPDSTWILRWPLETQASTANALMQAAVNRTWEPHCHEVFAGLWRDAEAFDASVGPKLAAALAVPNFYDRIAALRALVAEVDVESPRRGFAPQVGPAARVHKALIEAFAAGKRGWLAAHYFDALAKGRPARDEATERTLFCATAKWDGGHEHGTAAHGVAPLPVMLEEGTDQNVVRWPGATREETKQYEAIATEAERAFWAAKPAGAVAPGYGVGRKLDVDAREPTLVRVQATVSGVAANGRITVTDHNEVTAPYGCVKTQRVIRIQRDGTLEYEERCKHKTIKEDLFVTLDVPELPMGVTIQKGDLVNVFFDLTSDAPKTVVDTVSRAQFERRGAGVVRHVRLVQRGNTKVFAFE